MTIATVIVLATGFNYFAFNDHLTEPQYFKSHWTHYAIAGVFLVAGMVFSARDSK